MPEIKIGEVEHYFTHLQVAAVKLAAELKVGDEIHFKGHTTDFVQTVESMQVEHKTIESAKPGDDIGLKVKEHVRAKDAVFKVVP